MEKAAIYCHLSYADLYQMRRITRYQQQKNILLRRIFPMRKRLI